MDGVQKQTFFSGSNYRVTDSDQTKIKEESELTGKWKWQTINQMNSRMMLS